MSNSHSPNSPRGRKDKEERPRFFDTKAKSLCWANAEIVPGRHPERWRKDAAGNIVCKRFCNCHGCLCFEYDHIIPYSKGGQSTADNCQILQTRVNRYKADKEQVDKTLLRGYSCDVQFTGFASYHFKCIEEIHRLNSYGGATNLSGDFIKTNSPTITDKSSSSSKFSHVVCANKEMDIIEMAVYGDVIRPGNQCRCRSVAEMLGKFKSKDDMAACKLPNNESL
ncbi:HNH endonuclease [Dillenia turbinata]|uniref:HNH endonuclease n=1 Tax=Dillenia turbinata TaxID=194707 RepID=A0AAN8UY11_9MAGN